MAWGGTDVGARGRALQTRQFRRASAKFGRAWLAAAWRRASVKRLDGTQARSSLQFYRRGLRLRGAAQWFGSVA
jgi:hypothetical protein